MRLPSPHANVPFGTRAFTLVEIMITMVTLVIIIGSVIMCNLYGLSMATRQQIWLGASDDAAKTLGKLMTDIRSAVALQVGSYANGSFTQTAATSQQSGNALLLYATTNTSNWTLYYYNPATTNLIRTNYYGSGLPGDSILVSANFITNDSTHPIFTEVDYTGTPYSNASIAPVAPSVNIYLSFTKLQDPDVVIASGSAVDLYQILATATPRSGL
jgi:type II secretory pathway pseudopilin PulG